MIKSKEALKNDRNYNMIGRAGEAAKIINRAIAYAMAVGRTSVEIDLAEHHILVADIRYIEEWVHHNDYEFKLDGRENTLTISWRESND